MDSVLGLERFSEAMSSTPSQAGVSQALGREASPSAPCSKVLGQQSQHPMGQPAASRMAHVVTVLARIYSFGAELYLRLS